MRSSPGLCTQGPRSAPSPSATLGLKLWMTCAPENKGKGIGFPVIILLPGRSDAMTGFEINP